MVNNQIKVVNILNFLIQKNPFKNPAKDVGLATTIKTIVQSTYN